jgi:TetR/AcrR family fatty acid metabolism transcriptional regulator
MQTLLKRYRILGGYRFMIIEPLEHDMRHSMKTEDKKAKILASAEEIMSQKGLADSTISEIAQRAGVADSVIYQYFKGKQELLFSIPGERMKEVLGLLDEQLQGIRDAESRLRKMIWFHLRYNDTHAGYSRILLLECRSSHDFYKTPAYRLIREYAKVLSDILKRGAEDGSFRPDLDIRLMRDIVLGTLDWETISCLASGEIAQSAPDLEDIMALVHAMISKTEESETHKADRILFAAERVFSQKGFTKATISEIAKSAGVAEGTVYDYFENKEDLLLSIPVKRFGKYLDELPDTFHIKSPLRKLRRFIRYHFSLFLMEREFLKVFLLQIQLNKRFYGSKAFEAFRNYFRVIEEIIEEGKREGSFHSEVNPRIFRNMFLGTFSHLALRWIILGKETDTDKMQEISQVADLLSSAVTFSGWKPSSR